MEKTIYFGCFKLPKRIKPLTKNRKMKRKLFLALSAALLSTGLMAGGIMTNSNQSASYARMLARNASLGIDAVYYNPAGLTKLGKGFYLSLNNQSIFQTKDVTNNYKYLNGTPDAKYTGIVKAPVFPGVYAVYSLDKFAFSFGFNPVGGGGGAKYDTGLPSFEMGVADLVPSLASKGVNKYKMDASLEGTSVFFGYQGGVSYKINEMISVFAGVRYVTAKNTYVGHLSGIELYNFGGGGTWTAAHSIMSGFATSAGTAKAGTSALVNGGAGAYTLAQARAANIITPETQAALEGALTAFGSNKDVSINVANAIFAGAEAKYKGAAVILSDQSVDNEQTGSSITPVFGVNLSPSKQLNIGIKYELATKIELTNKTTKDFTTGFTTAGVPITMFPDGIKTRSDMPALLAIGTSYDVTEKFKASLSYIYYFDKSADYGKKNSAGEAVKNADIIDKNYFELALGLEYSITDKFMVSGGYLHSQTGVSNAYQSDLSYSLTSNSGAIGGQYKITPGIAVNLGALVTKYNKSDRTFSHTLGTTSIPVTENLAKTTWLMSIGLDIKIGK